MRIISDYHDYYDSVGAYFRSYNHAGYENYKDIVFKRKELSIIEDKQVSPEEKLKYHNDWSINASSDFYLTLVAAFDHKITRPSHFYREKGKPFHDLPHGPFHGRDNLTNKASSYNFYYMTFIFCGKIYYCVEVRRNENDTFSDDRYVEYFYDYDSLVSYFENNDDKMLTMLSNKRKTYFRGSVYSYLDEIKKYFDNTSKESKKKDFLIENKITIARLSSDYKIIVNPQLNDHQFYRVVDSYTAYQEVDMWVSGVLAYPPNFMVDIDDEYKVLSHGFDEKYGFRTRPSKKKKK